MTPEELRVFRGIVKKALKANGLKVSHFKSVEIRRLAEHLYRFTVGSCRFGLEDDNRSTKDDSL